MFVLNLIWSALDVFGKKLSVCSGEKWEYKLNQRPDRDFELLKNFVSAILVQLFNALTELVQMTLSTYLCRCAMFDFLSVKKVFLRQTFVQESAWCLSSLTGQNRTLTLHVPARQNNTTMMSKKVKSQMQCVCLHSSGTYNILLLLHDPAYPG